jgi:hypothetical protein
MQQVLVVQTAQDCPSIGIPSKSYIICKVYDPRFCLERHEYEPYVPWTLEAEVEAAEQRQKQPPLPISEFKHWIRPDDDDAVGYEEWYYQHAELAFHSEISAYWSLASLQGIGIPRCFGAGTLTPPDARAIVPRVLLLEYLPDATTLANVNPSLITPSLVRSLVDTVSAFGPLGVVHDDLNAGNVLFAPADNPTRAAIIDFGSAILREEEDSDEEWAKIVWVNNDSHGLKLAVRRRMNMVNVADFPAFLASDSATKSS